MSAIVSVKNTAVQLGNVWIHQNISVEFERGEIIAIIGSSGSGKSTLLREILGLIKPDKGSIHIFDQDLWKIDQKKLLQIKQRCGVLFQQGALFSSLNVLENILFPLKYFTKLNHDTMVELALLKLYLVGLSAEVIYQYPSELSGGMQKRAALARALILDPELLFLDEPSSGLDPVSAASQDKLLLDLQKALGLTIVMVTHDINTLENITDRILFLGEKKVLAFSPLEQLKNDPHPAIKAYFQQEIR